MKRNRNSNLSVAVPDTEPKNGEPDENEATAFLIRSKRGYGHQAKQTEIRFYIV